MIKKFYKFVFIVFFILSSFSSLYATTTVLISKDFNEQTWLKRNSIKWYCFVNNIFNNKDERCYKEISVGENDVNIATSTTAQIIKNTSKNNVTSFSTGGPNTNVVFINKYVQGPKGEKGADGKSGTTTIIYGGGAINGVNTAPTVYVNPGFNSPAIFQTTVPGDIWDTYIHNLRGDMATITSLVSSLINTFSINANNGNITNLTSQNANITNATTTNLFSINASITNATTTNLYGIYANILDILFKNASGTNLNIVNVNSTGTFTFATGTTASSTIFELNNVNASSTNLFSYFANILDLLFNNATGTNLTTINSSTTNLLAINSTTTNATTTNAYIQNGKLYIADIDNVKIQNGIATLTAATITDLFVNNILGNNASITNATNTNLFSLNASITNATITNLSVPNTLSSLVNVMTSNVGGSISTTTIVNSNIINYAGDILNSITSTVNGVFSSTTIASLNNLSLIGSTTAQDIKTDFLNSTNSVFTNSTTTNGYIQNVKIENGVATLTAATITDLFVNNIIGNNSSITNSTSTNIFSSNATVTNLFANIFTALTAFFENLRFTNATGTNLTVENLNTTNLIATGTFALATGTIASTAIDNLTVNNIIGNNATFTNLFATNTNAINSTVTNFVASTTYSKEYFGILARLQNLEANNILATNSTITNAFTTNQRYKTLDLNLSASGDIGISNATVDVATAFNVTSSGNLSLTIPAPTDATPGKIAYINNVGTTTFALLGSSVLASSSRSIIWTGNSWMLTGDGIGNFTSATSSSATSSQYALIKYSSQAISTSTLQNDNNFAFAVGANQTWYFNISARLNPSSNGPRNVKTAMSLPAGTTNCSFSLVEDRDNTFSNANICTATTQTSATDGNNFMNFIYTGVFTTGLTSGTAQFQWAKVVNGSPTLTMDAADTNTLTAFRISGADLGEVYYSNNGQIPFGEIVSLAGDGVSQITRSTKEYDSAAIGIVSTKPGNVLGEIDGTGAPVVVGLSGRVPVKVSLKNGEIKAGDYITTSDIPGVGMKAVKSGRVVGKALTSLSGDVNESGMVMVFIQNTYFEGENGNDFTSQISTATSEVMDRFTNSFKNTFEKLSDVLLEMNLVVKSLTADKIVTKEICINETCIVEEDLKEFLKYKTNKIDTQEILSNTTTTTDEIVLVDEVVNEVATETGLIEGIENTINSIIENVSTATEEIVNTEEVLSN